MKRKNRIYGIRNKLIIFTVLTAILPLLAGGGVMLGSINENISALSMENYSYIHSKVTDNFEMIESRSKEQIQNFVTITYVQKSLRNVELSPQEQVYINRSVGYTNSQYAEYGIYIDNKGRMYYEGKLQENTDYEDVLDRNLLEKLNSSYARISIGYGSIHLDTKDDTGLFMLQNVRHMELNVPRGILILKLNDSFFNDVFEDVKKDPDIRYFITDTEENICYSSTAAELPVEVAERISRMNTEKGEPEEFRDADRMYFVSSDENGEFLFVTSASMRAIYGPVIGALCKAAGIIVASVLLSIVLAVVISRPFLRGIGVIKRAMKGFNEESFDQVLELNTETELDQIAESYNKMLSKIEKLLNQVKQEQEELRKSEYNLLVHQINPHFLYNTLDNIHMLARMKENEKTTKLIRALSRMLRIGLSKGETEISLAEEIQHVQAYLDIEQIRTDGLFSYDYQIDDAAERIKIPKLILQPIVENSIKYGFARMETGGIIKIKAEKMGCRLIIKVYNNGIPIDPDVKKALNNPEDEQKEMEYSSKEDGGYGITNVVSRLKIRYGSGYRLFYRGGSNGTLCRIEIPLD